MPQMYPLLWLNLMLMFLTAFIIFYSTIHFFKLPLKIEKSFKIKLSNQNPWKW